MTSAANIIKTLLVPGSIPFLVVGLVAGVALLYGTQTMQRWGRHWLSVLLLMYAFLSTPLGADFLSAPLLHELGTVLTRDAAHGAATVVVLSVSSEVYSANGQEVAELGKATAYNALEAARVYRLLGNPLVVASGGRVHADDPGPTPAEILCDALVRLGVPRRRIEVESRSRTTREQGQFAGDILRGHGVRTFVLVTEANHMPRALGTFRELGFDPVPSASPLSAPGPRGLTARLRPGVSELQQSDWASYEHLARAYYWARGWLPARWRTSRP